MWQVPTTNRNPGHNRQRRKGKKKIRLNKDKIRLGKIGQNYKGLIRQDSIETIRWTGLDRIRQIGLDRQGYIQKIIERYRQIQVDIDRY